MSGTGYIKITDNNVTIPVGPAYTCIVVHNVQQLSDKYVCCTSTASLGMKLNIHSNFTIERHHQKLSKEVKIWEQSFQLGPL